MSDDADRRAEWIGAALAGELTPSEQAELDEACRQDPSLQREVAELQAVLGRVRDGDLDWVEANPGADLADRVAAIGEPVGQSPTESAAEMPTEMSPHGPSWRGRVARGLVAACLVGAGVLGTLGYQWTVDAPPDGPPGTLGAVEPISFSGEPDGSDVEASLVAHTWGTETVLEVDGLRKGQTFEVVLVSRSGEELSSGTFIGSAATVECRMNAAIMRDEVAQVRIRSSGDTTVRLVADLPPATA